MVIFFCKKELDSRYQALLQMYGEKVEEADELKLDLQDIKAMYRCQVSLNIHKFLTIFNY